MSVKYALLAGHGGLALLLVVVSVLAVQARTTERLKRTTSVLLALVLAQTVVGDVLYPIYLRAAKPSLRVLEAGSRSVADVFEVKEHLAFFALVLALGACLVARQGRAQPGPLVRVLVAGAHAAIVLVATLGLVVASMRLP